MGVGSRRGVIRGRRDRAVAFVGADGFVSVARAPIELLVGTLDALVDHAHVDRGNTFGDVPRRFGADLHHVPLIGPVRLRRRGGRRR